jgi:Domain of unknown function (DUF6916)
MQMMSYEAFASHVHESFSLSLGESSVDVTLVQAQKKPARVVAGLRAEPFTLYFKSQSQVVLPQRLYPMSNAGMGKLSIFIVPIGREKDGVIYEAVFN